MAALRAAPIERRSITRTRGGEATWISASATATSVSRRSSPSTTRTISSRSTPASGCASKRGSWARAGSAPASSGHGSIRTGVPPRWTRSRSSPDIPPPYDTRSTITPLLKFAVHPGAQRRRGREHLGAGAARPRRPTHRWPTRRSPRSTSTGAGRDGSDARHRVDGSFGVRAGSRELESDLAYTRYLGQGSYRFDFGRHHVQATGMAGGITGDAPLFERFTLGDSRTLRGWDKYDIAPAGGDRVVYSSIEYRYTGLALFLDVGSVWDANTERQVRVSTGLRVPRRSGVLRRRLPAEHRRPEGRRHDGSADSGGWDPVVAPALAGRRGAARPARVAGRVRRRRRR